VARNASSSEKNRLLPPKIEINTPVKNASDADIAGPNIPAARNQETAPNIGKEESNPRNPRLTLGSNKTDTGTLIMNKTRFL
jgi:hypothetical protein